MPIRSIRVGAAQVFTTLDVSSNLSKLKEVVREASARGVQILLLPECALSGYAPAYSTPGDRKEYNRNEIEPAFKDLARTAGECEVATIVGTAWFDRTRGWVNRAIVTHPSGRVAGWSDKAYLLGADADYFAPADRLETIRVLGTEVGIGICFDIRFPEVWRILSQKGAEVLFNPLAAYGGSMWKIPVMAAHFRSRAAENQRFVVAANSGPLQMAVSEILDPAGLCLATANQEVEELIAADLKIGEFESMGRRHLPDFLSLLRKDLGGNHG
jgi:NAD+ synthase (glutamine-hydrolysing)